MKLSSTYTMCKCVAACSALGWLDQPLCIRIYTHKLCTLTAHTWTKTPTKITIYSTYSSNIVHVGKTACATVNRCWTLWTMWRTRRAIRVMPADYLSQTCGSSGTRWPARSSICVSKMQRICAGCAPHCFVLLLLLLLLRRQQCGARSEQCNVMMIVASVCILVYEY